MRLTVGMGSIDEYEAYVKAGADEIFVGYIPASWMEKYNIFLPLNRREVLYYNVQIGSKSELMILKSMVDYYRVPVTITFNALYYIPEAYPEVLKIMEECAELGFSSFIVADPGLLYYLYCEGCFEKYKLHISGELGEMNSYLMDYLDKKDLSRVIFHRKVSLKNMEAMIRTMKESKITEYEAFFLNEMCHFHGGFCHSFHCDEFCHMCMLPYKLEGAKVKDIKAAEDFEDYVTGLSGCGLCALWDLKRIGITYLKIVGRGNYIKDTISDIRQAKKAIRLLHEASSKEEYIQKMKKLLFKNGRCSGQCYYLE